MAGYIQDELDLKLLVLYIMDKAAGPLTFLQLLDLALCDGGVDYFSLTQAVGHMTATGQLSKEGDKYAITDKGRRNSAICESSLPYSVRMHCDENLLRVNEALRREDQVRAWIEDREDGTCTLHLSFSDGEAPLLELALLVSGREEARKMADRFRADPASLYYAVVEGLSGAAEEAGKEGI